MLRNLVVIVADTWRTPGLPGEPAMAELMPFLASRMPRARDLGPFLASSPWTMPSHLSLLGGLEPWRVSLSPTISNYEFPRRRSIAELWHEHGGVSALFSANEMISRDNSTALGYDFEFPRGWERVDRLMTSRLAGLNERFLARSIEAASGPPKTPAGAGLAPVFEFMGYGLQRRYRKITDGRRVARALNRFLRGAHSEPLHVLINLMETHEPYVPQVYPSSGRLSEGFFPAPNVSLFSDYLASSPGADRGFHRAYLDSVRELDRQLETIFAILQHHGIWSESLVVLVSDHGQCLGEHGFFGHGYHVYDELVRVPCYVWGADSRGLTSPDSPEGDWIDHRHLHDFLVESIQSSTGCAPDDWRERSRLNLGPAMSYYEGTLGRPTPLSRPLETSRGRRDVTQSHPIVRRIVRASANGGTVVLSEGPAPGRAMKLPPPDATISGDTKYDELERQAQRVLEGVRTRDPDSDVEERLSGWGYV